MSLYRNNLIHRDTAGATAGAPVIRAASRKHWATPTPTNPNLTLAGAPKCCATSLVGRTISYTTPSAQQAEHIANTYNISAGKSYTIVSHKPPYNYVAIIADNGEVITTPIYPRVSFYLQAHLCFKLELELELEDSGSDTDTTAIGAK